MKRLILALGIISLSTPPINTPCQAQSCAPVLNGLVGWWRGENNAQDSAGANHGTLVNGGAYAPAEVGQGFSLDGMDDNVVIPASPSLLSGPALTVAAWIRLDAASFGPIASQYDSSANPSQTP